MQKESDSETYRRDPATRLTRVAAQVERMLVQIDPTGPRDGTDDTPKRVAKMYLEELCAGYSEDIVSLLTTFKNEEYKGMVIVQDIPVRSLCEHHLIPFVGVAHVAYFPDEKLVGLSKLARVVDAYSRRLQVQERLTRQVCDAFEKHLAPRGVIVVVEAEHFCMTIRGVQTPGARTTTSAVTGLFEENRDGCKDEFFALLNR